MSFLKNKKFWILLLILNNLVFFPVSIFSQNLPNNEGFFDVRSASTSLNDGVYKLDARLQLFMSEEARDALGSGVPLIIELNIEIIRIRRFLPDARDAELIIQYELQYRPLSQRYIVQRLNSLEQESFSTLYSALNHLGRI